MVEWKIQTPKESITINSTLLGGTAVPTCHQALSISSGIFSSGELITLAIQMRLFAQLMKSLQIVLVGLFCHWVLCILNHRTRRTQRTYSRPTFYTWVPPNIFNEGIVPWNIYKMLLEKKKFTSPINMRNTGFKEVKQSFLLQDRGV